MSSSLTGQHIITTKIVVNLIYTCEYMFEDHEKTHYYAFTHFKNFKKNNYKLVII